MRQDERGMTLIEVLASIVILGMIIIGIMNLSGTSWLAAQKSDIHQAAQLQAEKYLGEVKDYLAEKYPPSNLPSFLTLQSDLQSKYGLQSKGSFTWQTPQIVKYTDPQPTFPTYPSHRLALQTVITCKDGSVYAPVIIFVIVTWS